MTAPLRITAFPIDWQNYDRGAVREAVAMVAESQYTHLDICPPWQLLQPTARSVDRGIMHILEQLIDTIQAAGMQCHLQLLAVRESGVLTVPDWHHGPDAIGFLAGRTRQPVRQQGTPVRINGHLRALNLADPYATLSWREAQLFLVRTVVGYFGSHPAVSHWHIGDGWSRLSDTTPAHATTWLTAWAQAVRLLAPRAHLVATVDAPNLLGHALSVATLAAHVDILQVDAAMPEIPHRSALRLSTPALVLHDLVAALSGRPTVVRLAPTVSGTRRGWLQTQWHQLPLAIAQLTDEDAERYAQALVAGLHPAGAAGIVVPLAPPGFAASASHARVLGMVMRNWTERAPIRTSTDAERFLHNPLRGFQMLWNDV